MIISEAINEKIIISKQIVRIEKMGCDPHLISFSTDLLACPETEKIALLLDSVTKLRLSSFSEKRKKEFVTGRYCAMKALKRAGYSRDYYPSIASYGAPCWPNAFVGSIAHKKGRVKAVVGERSRYRSVGIDLEEVPEKIPSVRLIDTVTLPEELHHEKLSLVENFTLLFSAKESLFKCLYPLLQKPFSFHDVRIANVDTSQSVFQASLTNSLNSEFKAGYRFSGRFSMKDALVQTSVAL